MSDELNKVEQTETPSVTVETGTPPEKVEKTFTQQEVDKIINSRFAREKAAFEKQLTEQKEAIERQAFDKVTELETKLAEKDKQLLGHAKGIGSDKLDEALALAQLKMQKVEGMTLDEALTQVSTEYPNLSTVKKSGLPVENNPAPVNPYWTEEMKRRHPDIYAKLSKK